MKTLLAALLLAMPLLAVAQTIDVDKPASYLPAELNKISLGMGIQDFQKAADTAAMERISQFGYLYIQFLQKNISANITGVAYKFDTPQKGINTHRPLYEIVITFTTPEAAESYASATFTSPWRPSDHAEKEWFLSTTKDYWLIVRKSQNIVTLAAMMTGTEWGFE